MENMDKGLTVPKWVLINLSKNTPNTPKFICPSPKVWDFDEKRHHWASVVRASNHQIINESNLALLWLSTYDTNF
jgi:hypothetical protein